MKIRAVIFDLDGTLADTAGEICVALNRTLAESGRAELSREAVAALIGRGTRTLVQRALGSDAVAADLDALVARFEAHYTQTIATEAALYPGAADGLHRLRAAGIALAVVTNKPRVFTQLLLERFELAALFAATVTGDDGIARKPQGDMLLAACARMATAPGETLMIGDSDNDLLAARAAGCPVWCVPYGYNEGRGPQALACDRIVDGVDAAAELILAG